MISWPVVLFWVLGAAALTKLLMLRRLSREVLASYDRGRRDGATEGYNAAHAEWLAKADAERAARPKRQPPEGVLSIDCADCGRGVWYRPGMLHRPEQRIPGVPNDLCCNLCHSLRPSGGEA
jgi:hypothetical protein